MSDPPRPSFKPAEYQVQLNSTGSASNRDHISHLRNVK